MIETQFLTDLLDQLDLALDQLILNDRNHDRFAIILIDNVAELAFHARIVSIADIELDRKTIVISSDSQKQLRRALGRGFDQKVRFGVTKGWISQEQCDAMIGLHGFRNSSYHQGLRHEEILHSLAIAYFRLVSEFLVSYNFGSYVTSSSDRVSYRALKYLGTPSYSYSIEHFTAAFRRLEEISVTLGDTLIRDLASDMSSTIESSDSSISFISCSDDTPERRDWSVVFAQTFVFTQDEDAEEKAVDLGYNKAEGKRLFDWLLEDYRWQVSRDPIPGWRNRLNSLRAEVSPWRALKKYCDFMEQTNDIRLTLYEVESEIDSYIDLQSDILRGK